MAGKYVYGEWIVPLKDYFKTIKKREVHYEIIIPLILSTIIISICAQWGNVYSALYQLRNLLPSTLAILIGFTITGITVLVSSDGENISVLKNTKTENRKIGDRTINVYQWMLITFTYLLIVEACLLLFVFFSAFLVSVFSAESLVMVLVGIEVVTFLHILLLLVRNITSFYFVFFK